ncbi:MAG: glycosyltransferase [Rhizobiaceae bacterium]
MSKFYLEILEDMGAKVLPVLIHRNPLEVISSLLARSDWPAQLSNVDASLLWLRHVLDAEYATRDLDRSVLSYHEILSDPIAALKKVAKETGASFSNDLDDIAPEVLEFLDRDQRHHFRKSEEVALDPVLRGWVEDTYNAMRKLERSPNSTETKQVLDEVRAAFGASTSIIGALSREARDAKQSRQVEVEELGKQLQAQKTELSEVSASLNLTSKELERARHDIETERQTVIQKDEQIEAIAERLGEQQSQASALRERIGAREGDNRDIVELVDAHLEGLAAEHLEKLEEQGRQFDEERSGLIEKISEVQAVRDQISSELAGVRGERDAVSAELSKARLEKETTVAELQIIAAADADLKNAFDALSLELRRERRTVLRPFYRNIYSMTGRAMRGIFPESFVRSVRNLVPNPDGLKHGGVTVEVPPTAPDLERPEHVSPATNKPDVFVFSIIDWDFRIQRPQHIARALSAGRRVFYVEMMMEKGGAVARKIGDNLWAIRLSMDGVGHIQPYTGVPDASQRQHWVDALSEFCDSVKATSFRQIIVQHPFWWSLVRHLPPEFEIIFDCMDDIAGFSNTTKEIIDLEHDLLSGCDKLVVSSQYLFDKYSDLKTPALIRNGGEASHFSVGDTSHILPSFLEKAGFTKQAGIIDVGYVGAIAEWFDHELVRQASQENPDLRFHICGSVTAPEAAQLQDLPNVTLYGEIPYREVPAFIHQMDVMIIPFKLLPIIQACDPVKFYEYSAMEKPTVSTRLPELRRAEELVYFADNPGEFSQQIRTAFSESEDADFKDRLKTYTSENTWAHRGDEFETVLEDNPKVSIVILAYGEAHWTSAVLLSLFDGGAHYPNLEIIVVDNGSDEGTLAELRTICASFPGVNLIENGENLGFARGNNVGIAAASGEYVMLLNNDTYLAPGAINAMVRHLASNPDIGVVGPMTNNIGNEAKLNVDYADMAEMKRVARAATLGYRGQFTQIPVVAYFAAMFRKADLDKFGTLPEDYGRGMFEDDDHCEVIRSQGKICALAEDAFVHHHLSGTFDTIGAGEKQALFEKNKAIFEKKWGEWKPHEYRTVRPARSFDG